MCSCLVLGCRTNETDVYASVPADAIARVCGSGAEAIGLRAGSPGPTARAYPRPRYYHPTYAHRGPKPPDDIYKEGWSLLLLFLISPSGLLAQFKGAFRYASPDGLRYRLKENWLLRITR